MSRIKGIKFDTVPLRAFADSAEVTEARIFADVSANHLILLKSKQKYEVVYDVNARLYEQFKGDTTKYKKKTQRAMAGGEFLFTRNNIKAYIKQRGNLWLVTACHPDKSKIQFRDIRKDVAITKAMAYCMKNLSFAGRDVSGHDIGWAVYVCLTYPNIIKLLSVLPDSPENKYLIGKLRKALKDSVLRKKKRLEKINEKHS